MRSLRCSGNISIENWRAAIQEHEQMMQGLQARDGKALAKYMGQHIRNSW